MSRAAEHARARGYRMRSTSEIATLARRVLLTGHDRAQIRVAASEPHAALHKETGFESLQKLLATL
jgi:hypothetical protein